MGRLSEHRIFGHYTRTLAWTSALLALSSANFGFDNQGFASTQAMTPFVRQFGNRRPNGTYFLPTDFLAQLNSLVFITFAVGAVAGGKISERYGRRLTIFLMSLWAIMSAIINITAKTKGQILAGRLINYVYIGMELSTVPMFQGEIVPAPVRGFAVATYQFSIIAGGIVINAICRGTSELTTNKAWQIPYCTFVVIPTIVASGIWFCPESPRWLMSVGREEEARACLQRYKGAAAGFDLEEEVARIRAAIEVTKEKGTWGEVIRGTNRKRLLIAAGVKFFLQSTGQHFTSKYGAVYVRSLGTVNPFNYSLITSCLGTVANALSMYLSDTVGRRKLLIAGAIAQTCVLITQGSLGVTEPVSKERSTAIVAMVVLFGFAINASWAPQGYVVIGELPSQRMRDKTIMVANVVNILVSFVVTYSVPYMLDAIGSKVGFVFGACAILAIPFTYFCVPECRGLSLEQVDLLFREGVPMRKFGTVGTQRARDAELGQLSNEASSSPMEAKGEEGEHQTPETAAKMEELHKEQLQSGKQDRL